MDKETIIKGCENWVNNHKDENLLLTYSSVVELLATLKEQEEQIKNRDESLEKAREEIKWLRGMLKEQEAIIRCEDCTNRHDSINCQMYSEGIDTSDDWFCADGKHKEGW